MKEITIFPQMYRFHSLVHIPERGKNIELKAKDNVKSAKADTCKSPHGLHNLKSVGKPLKSNIIQK